MRTTSLVKATHQLALPAVHLHSGSLGPRLDMDAETRRVAVAALARLLLEAAASERLEEDHDEA